MALLANGLRTGSTVFVVFSILQIITGINNLRYNFKKELKPKKWWLQHLNGLFGAGIGAYTAFFVFGGRCTWTVYLEIYIRTTASFYGLHRE